MNSKNNIKNAYKGLLLNFYFDFKKVVSLGIIVTLSITLFNFIMTIIMMNIDYSTENSGVLMIGFFTMLITLFVYTILSTSREELHSKFAFPINRSVYAISNLFSILAGAFVMLLITTIILPIEIFLLKFVSLFTDKLIFLNTVTLPEYIRGFISSWGYMVALASVTYCIFMFIRKYMMYTLPAIAILFTCLISFGWLGDIVEFIFAEQNLSVLMIKLLSITLVSHILGFIPLKRMEVA